MDIKRLGLDDVDTDTLDIELEMETHAQHREAFLGALGRYALGHKAMPLWLAQAVCSPWGRSVLAAVITQAEAAVNPNKLGQGKIL